MEVPSLKERKPLTTQVVRGGITRSRKVLAGYIQQAIDDIVWGEEHDPSMIDCYESALVAELSAAYASGRITKNEIEDIRRKYLHEE